MQGEGKVGGWQRGLGCCGGVRCLEEVGGWLDARGMVVILEQLMFYAMLWFALLMDYKVDLIFGIRQNFNCISALSFYKYTHAMV